MNRDIVRKLKVCWNITNVCNDACPFCFRDTSRKPLGTPENKRVLSALASDGVDSITFAGGEPLLVPGIFDMIAHAHFCGLETTLVTNAILLTREALLRLDSHLDWLTFSLDSLDPLVQSTMGRNPQHVKNVITALDLASETLSRTRFKINTVISRVNRGSLQDIFTFVNRDTRIARWKVMQFTPLRGASISSASRYALEGEEYHSVIASLDFSGQRKGLDVSLDSCRSIRDLYVVISPDGSVIRWSGDSGEETVIGNVRKESIQAILLRSGMDFTSYQERVIRPGNVTEL